MNANSYHATAAAHGRHSPVAPNRWFTARLALLTASLSLGLLVQTLGQAQSGEPVELKAKWPIGRRYLQRMSMVQTQKIFMPGASEPMNQELKQTQDYALLVAKERPEGGRELQLDNTGFTMEMKMGDTTMLKFDSKSDPKEDGSNPLAPVLRKMVATPPFKFLLAADGKVDKVEGVKELLDSLGSEGPPEVQMMLKWMLSEDNFKQMGALPQGLPEKPVKLGERWPVKMDVALGPLGGISIHIDRKSVV